MERRETDVKETENRSTGKLSNPQNTIQVIQKHGFAFQKKFGQNFLIDAHVLDKIIAAAGVTADDMVKKLAEEYNGGKPIKVVANLPYYITTPIIMGLFESGVPIDNITVMVQKEVADRMQVGPGSKDYGALSLAVQYYAEPYIVANVPPNCFIPRPNVGSAVIRLTRHQTPPVEVKDRELMFKLIRASFNQRRKTLLNGLNNSPELSFGKEQIAAAIEQLGVPAAVRGEALTLEQFSRLSDLLGGNR